MKTKKKIAMKNKPIIIFTLLYSISLGQEISAKEIMARVHSIKRQSASIMEIRLDITRVKRKKEKIKAREFIRYEKYYYPSIAAATTMLIILSKARGSILGFLIAILIWLIEVCAG